METWPLFCKCQVAFYFTPKLQDKPDHAEIHIIPEIESMPPDLSSGHASHTASELWGQPQAMVGHSHCKYSPFLAKDPKRASP